MKILPSLFSPAGKNARLSIVIHHRVIPEPDLLLGDGGIKAFETGLNYLVKNFNVLPLSEAVNRLQNGTLPDRTACITFDDGYADNAEIALPLLQKYGVPATFFVASSFLDGGRMWNDTVIESIRLATGDTLDLSSIDLGIHAITTLEQKRETLTFLINKLKYLPYATRALQVEELNTIISARLPDNLMMTSVQVRQLHNAGMEIGAHTVTHPILGKPGKDYLSIHTKMVKDAGFDAAVSTAWGAARQNSDIFQLPRFTPWDKDELRYVLRMVRNMHQQIQVA